MFANRTLLNLGTSLSHLYLTLLKRHEIPKKEAIFYVFHVIFSSLFTASSGKIKQTVTELTLMLTPPTFGRKPIQGVYRGVNP